MRKRSAPGRRIRHAPWHDHPVRRLSELRTGESGTILKVLGHGGFRRRIMEMGFVRGKRVEVLQNAPLHDPIEYRIMGYGRIAAAQRGRNGRGRHRPRRRSDARSNAMRALRPTAITSGRSSPAAAAGSTSHWWAIPTAARPRYSTPYRAATSTWAITAG